MEAVAVLKGTNQVVVGLSEVLKGHRRFSRRGHVQQWTSVAIFTSLVPRNVPSK